MPSNATIATGSFATGKFGQALVNGRASATSLSTQTTLTVECWFKTTDASSPNVLVAQPGVFWMGLSDGYPQFTIEGSGNTAQNWSATRKNDGAWHHLALVMGAANCRLYVDGVEATQARRSKFADNTTDFSLNPFFPSGYSAGNGTFTTIGAIDEIAVWSGERYTADFSVPTGPYAGTEANLLRLYSFDGDGVDDTGGTPTPTPTPTPSPSLTTIARTNAALFWSPGAWCDDGTSRMAAAPGAYVKFGFTGTSLRMLTTALGNLSAFPQVRAIIDGIAYDVGLSTATTFTIATGLSDTTHSCELYLRASLWSAGSWWTLANALKITGFQIDSGKAVSAPNLRSKTMLLFGDSLTQGYFVDGTSSPGQDDALATWAPIVAEALDAEYGQIGWGGTNFAAAGVSDVPAFNTNYASIASGYSRLTSGQFTTQPDYIAVMLGTNGVAAQSDVATAISNLRAAAPGAWLFFVVPGAGQSRAAITAAVAAAIAAGTTRIATIDAGTRYQTGLASTSGGATEAAFDSVHYKRRTNARLAGAWLRQIQHQLEPRRFTIAVS